MNYLGATHACPSYSMDKDGNVSEERLEPCVFIGTQENVGGQVVYRYRDLNPDGIRNVGTFYTIEPLAQWGIPTEQEPQQAT